MKRIKGFTLIELLIVVCIVGLLVSISMGISNAGGSSESTVCKRGVLYFTEPLSYVPTSPVYDAETGEITRCND